MTMKKLNKIVALLLALTMALALTACGGSDTGSSGGSSAAPKTTSATGDMVTVEVPEGWSLVTGSDMFGTPTADFVCHSESYKVGDAYLQIEQASYNLDDLKGILESGSPYGTYSGEQALANGTWYLAENAAAAQLGDKVILVKGYKCDLGSAEVHTVLGSLQWVK